MVGYSLELPRGQNDLSESEGGADMRSLKLTLLLLLITSSFAALSQVGAKVQSTTGMFGDLVEYFASPQYWSGHGKAFSEWYSVSTPPTPLGYYLVSQEFSLQGDRACGGGDRVWDPRIFTLHINLRPVDSSKPPSGDDYIMPEGSPGYGEWAVCRLIKRSDGGVVWQFALQGHEERRSLHVENFKCCNNGVSMNFKIEGDAATSAGLIKVIYRKGKRPEAGSLPLVP